MIIKIIASRSGGNTLSYIAKVDSLLLEKNVGSITPDDQAAEFRFLNQLRPGLKYEAIHVVIALAPGEALTEAEWLVVLERVLRSLGLDQTMYVARIHTDNHIQHLHSAHTVVDFQGKRVDRSNDRYKAQKVARELEVDFNLRQLRTTRQITRAEREAIPIYEGVDLVGPDLKGALFRVIHQEVVKGGSLGDLADRLWPRGVQVEYTTAPSGAVTGLGYRVCGPEGGYLTASQVHNSFTLKKLQTKYGITFDPGVDLPRLISDPRYQKPTNEVVREKLREAQDDLCLGSRLQKSRVEISRRLYSHTIRSTNAHAFLASRGTQRRSSDSGHLPSFFGGFLASIIQAEAQGTRSLRLSIDREVQPLVGPEPREPHVANGNEHSSDATLRVFQEPDHALAEKESGDPAEQATQAIQGQTPRDASVADLAHDHSELPGRFGLPDSPGSRNQRDHGVDAPSPYREPDPGLSSQEGSPECGAGGLPLRPGQAGPAGGAGGCSGFNPDRQGGGASSHTGATGGGCLGSLRGEADIPGDALHPQEQGFVEADLADVRWPIEWVNLEQHPFDLAMKIVGREGVPPEHRTAAAWLRRIGWREAANEAVTVDEWRGGIRHALGKVVENLSLACSRTKLPLAPPSEDGLFDCLADYLLNLIRKVRNAIRGIDKGRAIPPQGSARETGQVLFPPKENGVPIWKRLLDSWQRERELEGGLDQARILSDSMASDRTEDHWINHRL